MIQRIQSVFMALAALSALLLFFFPIAWFYGGSNTIAFYVYGMSEYMPGAPVLKPFAYFLPVLVLTAVLFFLPIVTVLKYKQLKKQYSWMRINMFLSIILIAGLLLYYTGNITAVVGAEPSYEFGVFIPLIILVFSFLAMRGIKKDLKLLRSVDRLR